MAVHGLRSLGFYCFIACSLTDKTPAGDLSMRYGMNLLLWTGELSDEMLPVLHMLKNQVSAGAGGLKKINGLFISGWLTITKLSRHTHQANRSLS